MKEIRKYILLGLLPFLLTGCGALPRIVILHDPLSSEEHLRLGERYEADGMLDLALAEYESALKGGRRAEVFAHLGTAYSLKGEDSRAESFYLKSLGEQGDQPRVLNNLAALYAGRGVELEAAEGMAREAMRLDPEHRPYYLETLSEVYLAQGKYEQASDILAEAERTAPIDPLLSKSIRRQRVRLDRDASTGSGVKSIASSTEIRSNGGSSVSEGR